MQSIREKIMRRNKNMLHKLADHCAELHRRHVHIITVAIAVAASVTLYFVLPILLLAKEIAMSTPVIHRFRVAYAQDAATTSPTINPAPIPSAEATGTCPAGQYLGQNEKGEAQCMFSSNSQQPTTGGDQMQPQQPMSQQQPMMPQQPIQVYPLPPGKTCPAGEVYTKNDQGQITCVRVEGMTGKAKQMGPNEIPEMEEEFVDPREIKNALADIKRMRSQLKSFTAKLKKLQNTADDLAKITEIQTAISSYEAKIKNPSEDESLRDTLHEFYDNGYWDEINIIRAKVELPTEIKSYTKDLTRVKKLLTNKIFIKLGFDMEALKSALTEMEAAIADVETKYNNGDLEGAMDDMQNVRDSGHPGEIQGTMYQVRDIVQRSKSIRSKEIQAQIQEIIQPIIDSFNKGEYRDANQALQEISVSLMKMLPQVMRMNSLDDATNEKLQKLQQTIEDKLGGREGIGQPEEGGSG